MNSMADEREEMVLTAIVGDRNSVVYDSSVEGVTRFARFGWDRFWREGGSHCK
jgi:hypothetical protein